MQEINMPPFAPVLMESTRALGYSAEAAIADVLDNSISAGATRISLRFSPFDEAYFSVLDNGKGMSSDELNTAMRYGSVSPLVVTELASRELAEIVTEKCRNMCLMLLNSKVY